MERRGGGLDPANELVVFVHEDMEFVAELGLRALLCPGATARWLARGNALWPAE
jgi:hypothetical protein